MAISVKSIIDQIAFEIGDVAHIEGQQKLPPKFYIQIINKAIIDIYTWLLEKELYYDIQKETITLAAGVQTYTLTQQGKTLRVYKDTNIELDKKPYKFYLQYQFQADPEYYFETLKQIGFIPIPNAVKNIIREYVPVVPAITGTTANETVDYPDIIFPLLVTIGCLATMTITPEKEKEWFTQKSNLFPLWQAREKELKNTILKYYEPVSTVKNIFND